MSKKRVAHPEEETGTATTVLFLFLNTSFSIPKKTQFVNQRISAHDKKWSPLSFIVIIEIGRF